MIRLHLSISYKSFSYKWLNKDIYNFVISQNKHTELTTIKQFCDFIKDSYSCHCSAIFSC